MNDDRMIPTPAFSPLRADATPIRRRKLGQEVLDRLLTTIQSGGFPTGSHLPSERELMKLYSVGRPAVREALQGLERMGLVSIVHGERARVLALSPESVMSQMSDTAVHLLSSSKDLLEHFKEARLMLETGMVRIAAERATEIDIVLLRKALETQRASIADRAKFLRADAAFHRAIAAVSQNPICAAVVQGMLDWIAALNTETDYAMNGADLTLHDYETIVKSISARDAEGAAKAMAEYINRGN
jgi:GntR family transcriptional regulator, sialic acid-inducible nan operon repressor